MVTYAVCDQKGRKNDEDEALRRTCCHDACLALAACTAKSAIRATRSTDNAVIDEVITTARDELYADIGLASECPVCSRGIQASRNAERESLRIVYLNVRDLVVDIVESAA